METDATISIVCRECGEPLNVEIEGPKAARQYVSGSSWCTFRIEPCKVCIANRVWDPSQPCEYEPIAETCPSCGLSVCRGSVGEECMNRAARPPSGE